MLAETTENNEEEMAKETEQESDGQLERDFDGNGGVFSVWINWVYFRMKTDYYKRTVCII